MKFMGYVIEHVPVNPKGHQWEYTHEGYDGPEDNRHGTERTFSDTVVSILELEFF